MKALLQSIRRYIFSTCQFIPMTDSSLTHSAQNDLFAVLISGLTTGVTKV